ncbi:glycosyltransferase family 4 protein [bacterium]|nr:glycosyltransferase family 4 protein [bacterium]
MNSHVLIIVENLPVPRDYRAWLIASSLRKAGCKVTVLSPSDEKAKPGVYKKDGVTIVRHRLYQAKSWLGYPREYLEALCKEFCLMRKIYRKTPFQIIHACNPPDLIWLPASFFKKRGVKYVFDHHDLCPELILAKKNTDAPEKLAFPFGLLYRLMLWLEKKAVRKADLVLSTNATYEAIALERDGLAAEKSFVVRSGPRKSDLVFCERKAGGEEKTLKLAYVGVMARQDGVDILLRAAAILKEKKLSFQLALMGDGPEFENLKALAKALDLEKETEFTGFLKKEEFQKRLLSSDLGVTPDPLTPMNDASTMLKTFDYMAAGLPQVMFDLKEHRATCQNAAVYVSPSTPEALAEGIMKLAADKELRQKLAGEARARIGELTWEGQGEAVLLQAYASL